jgi:acetyltransferase-like isoleucine patch superfamily enzyme
MVNFRLFFSEWYEHFISNLPNNRLGMNLRYSYYKKRLASCRGWFSSKAGLKIYSPEYVSIGERCQFSDGVIICATADGPITIGNDVIFGFRSAIVSGNRLFESDSNPINAQGSVCKPVVIMDNVWIGSDVKILAGVSIGGHSVIGANAVVTHDIPPHSLAVGVPARVVKKLAGISSMEKLQDV